MPAAGASPTELALLAAIRDANHGIDDVDEAARLRGVAKRLSAEAEKIGRPTSACDGGETFDERLASSSLFKRLRTDVTSIATDVSNVRAEVKTQNGEVLTALAAINGKLDGKTTNTSDPKPPGGIPLNRAPRLPLAEPLLGGSTEEALETMNDDELAAALDEFIEAIIPNRSVVGTTHLS